MLSRLYKMPAVLFLSFKAIWWGHSIIECPKLLDEKSLNSGLEKKTWPAFFFFKTIIFKEAIMKSDLTRIHFLFLYCYVISSHTLFWQVEIPQNLYVGVMHILFASFIRGVLIWEGGSLFTEKWWAQSENETGNLEGSFCIAKGTCNLKPHFITGRHNGTWAASAIFVWSTLNSPQMCWPLGTPDRREPWCKEFIF